MLEQEAKFGKVSNIVRWAIVALYAVMIVVAGNNPASVPGMILSLGMILMYLHAPKRYGWQATFVLVITAFVVGAVMEGISIQTGFPFGPYNYNMGRGGAEASGNSTLIMIGLFYGPLCYLSWTVASVIMNHADRRLDKKLNIIAMPIIAAFIMCQFDLVQDPSTSTFANIWTWHNGGGVFGVPMVNFLGWFLNTYIIFQIFTLYLAWKQKKNKVVYTPELQSKGYWMQPILFYLLIGLSYISQYIFHIDNTTVITDMGGNVWTVNTMYEAAVTIMLFTMLYSVVLAVFNLFKSKKVDISRPDTAQLNT
jgi:putative membrane protein